jgi:hypothetical protein
MRGFGFLLLAAGILGFLYFGSRLSGLEPVPAGVELGDYMRYEAGKAELLRYASAFVALLGVLLAMFPKGR